MKIDELIECLKSEDFDLYIGISLAGISVMYFFALHTGNKQLEVFYKGKDWSFISGKKVLLLDDTIESGKTILDTKEELEKFNPSSIKTLVLSAKIDSLMKPDFCLEYTREGISKSFNQYFCDLFRIGLCPKS